MNITSIIKADKYLNVHNCLDLSDLEYAINKVQYLLLSKPNSKQLKSLYARLLTKKERLTLKKNKKIIRI